MTKSHLAIFIFIFICKSLYSQVDEYQFNYLKTEDGLSSNKINCFFEDSLGFMWIGTDNGLNRFDGSNIKIFKADRKPGSIVHNNISTIIPDLNSSNFWIGTANGLNYFNLKTYIASPLPRSVDTSNLSRSIAVESLAFDKKGTLWIVTRSNIYKCNSTLSLITNFEKKYRRPNKAIFSSIVVSEDNQIIICGKKGLYTYNNSTKEIEFLKHIKVGHPKKLFFDTDKDLWVITYDKGVYLFKNGDLNSTPIWFSAQNGKLINNIAFDLIEYKPGIIYIINKEGGISVYNKTTESFKYIIPSISNLHGLNSKALISIGTDSKSNLWVGTFNNGVNFIDSKRKKIGHYFRNTGDKGLFNDNIRSIFQDSKGYIWIGTKEDGGLSRFDIKTGIFKHYRVDRSKPYKLQGDVVTAINEIDERYLLIGTFLDGLHVLDRKTDRFVQFKHDSKNPHSLDDNYVTFIKQHPNGKSIIGHGKGVDFFDFEKRIFTRFFSEQSGRCIFIEDQDSIWIGTLRGLYLLDKNGHTKRVYNTTNYFQKKTYPLKVNNVIAIQKNQEGTIWLASGYDGLHKMANDRSGFTKYNYGGNQKKDKIVGMLFDDHNNIWFSSKDGISKFIDSTKSFYHFNRFDGLQGDQFETHCALKTSTGYMIFGGRNGFNIFHPDSIKLNKTPPNVVLTEFKIFDKDVEIGEKDSPLSKHISQTKKIVLNYQQSMLSFEFVAISYSSPLKNEYAYMMEGVDDNWRHVGNIRHATYTNMREGDYVFKVKASNNDGVWNEEGVELQIKILPPWWRTIWFRLLLSFFVISILFSGYYYRVKQLTQQQALLKQKVKERTLELENKNELLVKQTQDLNNANSELTRLNTTKDKFFSIIAHDLRNPFSSILGLSDMLASEYNDINDDQRLKIIIGIEKSSKRVYDLLENLLNWSRSQRKTIKIVLEKISPYHEIHSIMEIMYNSLEKKNLEMVINIPKDLQIDSDPNLFEAIFRNFISNAIKFSQDGKLEVYSQQSPELVSITVKDCGIGMPQETIDKLFNSEFLDSTSGTMGESGTGIGLVICRDFIRLLRGRLVVKSEPGVGSWFIVELPKSAK